VNTLAYPKEKRVFAYSLHWLDEERRQVECLALLGQLAFLRVEEVKANRSERERERERAGCVAA
jgi:hypothetical protein